MDESFYDAEERRRVSYQASKYHSLLPSSGPLIDDKTWNDLSGDEFFAALDSCDSGPGRSALYALMRRPAKSEAAIIERQKAHESTHSDPTGLARVRKILKALGVSKEFCVYEYLESLPSRDAGRSKAMYPLICAASVLCYLAPVPFGPQALILSLAALAVNLTIYIRFKKRTVSESDSIYYVAKLISAAERLGKAKSSHFPAERARLRELGLRLAPLRKRCAFFFKSMNVAADFVDAGAEILKMFFLLEAINYSYARSGCVKEKASLAEVFSLIGGIDASLSASRYLDAQKRIAKASALGTKGLEAANVIHPLLREAVPNSISIAQRGIIITGTNMSGKSTFLRALGLNLVLVGVSGYALADSFRCSPLYPASAIDDADDLSRGKSRYLGEAERLLEFIRLCDKKSGALFLIDEILSGTNSSERTVAAISILRYLAGHGALTVAATHDLAIAAELDGAYGNYHFDDEVTQEGLRFDYRIKPGIVEKRNALKLLSFLGYPREIVESFSAAEELPSPAYDT